MSEAAEKVSQWLWLRCSQTTWGINLLSQGVLEVGMLAYADIPSRTLLSSLGVISLIHETLSKEGAAFALSFPRPHPERKPRDALMQNAFDKIEEIKPQNNRLQYSTVLPNKIRLSILIKYY